MVKKPLHPGELLRKHCLEPRGLTVTDAAKQIGITRQALNNILNGKTGISPTMAVLLAQFFGLRPETLQQWQKDYELGKARSGRARLNRARCDSFSVSSADLAAWADTIDARYALPKLVRALVRATTNSAGCVADFPAMEDAQNSGWDGLVENLTPSAYVPAGRSAWELSTDANPQSKAESDYRKRTENQLGVEPTKTALVLVTLRRWAHKRQWMASKNQEGIWAKVVVYDATDLEQWLDLAPEVAIWIAARIGRAIPGVQLLDTFWSEFSVSTAPPISPSLLLAGRGSAVDRAAEWFETGSGVLRLLADSTDEALAFMAAVGLARSTGSGNLLTNAIIVDDAEQARQLMATSHRLTFGWRLDDPSLLGTIIDKGHRAFVPVARSTAGAEHADLELPRLGRSEFVTSIRDTLRDQDDSKKEEEANLRARVSGRSITVYRRLYAAAGVSRPPRWASPEHAGELIPILLAGSWSESNEADRSALAELAGYDYTGISRLLARCRNQPDPPLRQIGDTWTLVAPLDAWSLLAKFITDVDLDRYHKVVLEILGEPDPALTLDPNERWLASLHQNEFRHSDSLRRGLAETLILLPVIGDAAGLRLSRTGANRSEHLVIELVGRGSNALKWASIFQQLPSLAEAAPEAFLIAVEDSLAATNPPLMTLFEVEKRPLGGGARHPHLLWALEILAWYPLHLSRVARVLAKLARRDPGGNLVNRPAQSLLGIFCCWHPNTSASLDERLKAIDSLLEWESDVAWNLLLELLPKLHDVGNTNAEPRWRALPERSTMTWGKIWRANEQIITRTLDQAALKYERLCQIVDRIGAWSPEQRSRFVVQIQSFSKACNVGEERTALWRELRGFVARSRTYLFLEESELHPFDQLLEALEPTDILERYSWLFDDDLPDLTHPKTRSSEQKLEIEDRMAEVATARREAVNFILRDRDVDGLLSLAGSAKLSYLVGQAGAEAVEKGPIELAIIERALATTDPKIRQAGLAFAWRRNEINGPDWSEDFLRSDSFKGWCFEMQAAFCRTLPEGRSTWRVVENLGRAVEEKFWKETAVFLIRLSRDEDAEFATEKLLEAGRVFDALDQAGSAPERLSTGLLARVLEAAIVALAKTEAVHRGMIDHGVERILQRLRASGELSAGDLGKLEMQYLPLLHPLHTPVTLYKALQSDPKFFADVVAHAFKPEAEVHSPASPAERSEGDEIVRNRARLAWDLLSKWSAMPGRQEDGTIDAGRLNDWFREARSLNAANNRARVGDIQIGRVLAYAPAGLDGIWPDEAVRNILEATESRDLESGLRAGRINQRGVWTKSPADGGRPERELAKRYRADAKALAARWPRTTTVLNSLADVYEGFGRHDDITAEALDLLP
jgi:addiction module HigA family antidote